MERDFLISVVKSALRFFALLSLLGFSAMASATTVSTDFENIGGSVPGGLGVNNFDVGPANFTGGISGVAFIPELYHSGNHAWMVLAGNTGVIQFGANVTAVSFYAITSLEATGNSTLRAYDSSSNLIYSNTVVAGDAFKNFSIIGAIDRIEFFNGDASLMNALDDFSVTTVPVPAAFWLFGTALFGILGFSKTKKSA
jgi:hypothetical protein